MESGPTLTEQQQKRVHQEYIRLLPDAPRSTKALCLVSGQLCRSSAFASLEGDEGKEGLWRAAQVPETTWSFILGGYCSEARVSQTQICFMLWRSTKDHPEEVAIKEQFKKKR